ncbi:MAG TPA: gamma-glutamylcyclotransferase family protein [Pyrinomonadaceae bacterium]|jgi:hypothetical protein|nr:gamma-glutamylcyclotransferase family protein [Pyrinomonadaceae bacterium]
MPDNDQYIFGYGSLIDSLSRVATSPSASYASPVNVVGIQRGWFGRLDDVGPTYLAALPNPNSNCNGVIFKVSVQELEAVDEYESGYERKRTDPTKVIMLDDSRSVAKGDIWFYTCAVKRFATPESPILQSYVDTCLNGCFEIEASFPKAKEAKFAEQFLKTSSDWSKYWVNDRPQSERHANSSKIDELIRKVLTREN